MKTPNTIYHNATVTQERRNQLNGHKSVVIWFTGLSGSGISTLAHSVEEGLYKMGCITYVLDGDNVRHGLSSNLTFSDDDRKENIRRIGEAAKLMMETGGQLIDQESGCALKYNSNSKLLNNYFVVKK